MGMMLRLLNTVRAAVVYPFTRTPLVSDNFNRANGNLSPTAPWVHHIITEQYNRIVDGKVVGPSTSYAMDYANVRIPNQKGYIKGKLYTEQAALGNGGMSRLNFKSGKGSLPVAAFSFLTLGMRAGSQDRLAFTGDVFRQGWGGYPPWINSLVTDTPQHRPGDEIAVFWNGRRVTLFWDGVSIEVVLTDDYWTPGYFAGIGLDTNHSWDDIEIGYWGPLVWRDYGDNFESLNLEHLYNLSPNKPLNVGGAIQSDPAWATGTGTFYGWGVSRQQLHEDDQIIRATLKSPVGVTLAAAGGSFPMGRCGSDPLDAIPKPAFLVTPSAGAAIYTMANGVFTQRSPTVVGSQVGTITYPIEVELQCIGNRYFGVLDGQPICEWNDATNIVPIGEGRRGWGWVTSVTRTSSAYSHSPAMDALVANGLTDAPISPPEINGVSPATTPLSGGGTLVVSGTNFHKNSTVYLDGVLLTEIDRWSTNVISAKLPAKALGSYDVTVKSPNGDATMTGAVQYVAQVPYGKYDPTPTTLPSGIVYTKVPLSPENAVVQMATVDGVIVGLPRGFYRFRTTYTVSYYRTDIRHRLMIPAGATDPQLSTESSGGAVDKTTEFSVGANGTVELQFARSASQSKTVDATFDFELILVSTTRLPAGLLKSGTHVLGTVASVYEKVMGWTLLPDYDATTVATGDEILVSADGDYTLEFRVTYSASNTANVARVTDQLGTVLATKTNPTSLTTVVVSLKKGDSIKLEAMTTNVSTVARRTITAANTLFRITPV